MKALELLYQYQQADEIAGGYMSKQLDEAIKELEAHISRSNNKLDLKVAGESLNNLKFGTTNLEPMANYLIKTQEDTMTGDELEKLLKMTRFNSDESALRFASKLKRLGIDDELKKLGAKEGDTVQILDQEFEYEERLY